MSSSRWRRFAFFERSTLNLPTEVTKSLIPSSSSSSSSSAQHSASSSNNHLPPLDHLYTTAEIAEEGIPSSPSNYFSLSITTLVQKKSSLSSKESSASGAKAVVSLDSLTSGNQNDKTAWSSSSSSSSSECTIYAFLSSRNTNLVYILTIPTTATTASVNDSSSSSSLVRGSVTPFDTTKEERLKPEDRVLREHMGDVVTPTDHSDVVTTPGRIVNMDVITSLSGEIHLAVVTDAGDGAGVTVLIDPQRQPSGTVTFRPASDFDYKNRGKPRCVSLSFGIVAVGTSKGVVVVYGYESGAREGRRKMTVLMEISSPRGRSYGVTSLRLSLSSSSTLSSSSSKERSEGGEIMNRLFVGYKQMSEAGEDDGRPMGVCCYDLGSLSPRSRSSSSTNVAGRFDLDGRDVESEAHCGLDHSLRNMIVARADGLYIYNAKHRSGVAPIDGGEKVVMVCVPGSGGGEGGNGEDGNGSVSSMMGCYALIASKDNKSHRDALDIYDVNNKLVAFHTLLSPGHATLAATALRTPSHPTSVVLLTSGGALLTVTEKNTEDKISLLLQKNLYTAAIAMSYSDPSYPRDTISHLYRRYAEFLYKKGDYPQAMEQYKHTVGMNVVEPSHVIYRFLDAPKIPLLVSYLETLRERHLARDQHVNLLKACYYKLNQHEKASLLEEENKNSRGDKALQGLPPDPTECLGIIATWPANDAAAALQIHGSRLARALPRETAGMVLSLIDGTYNPKHLAEYRGEGGLPPPSSSAESKIEVERFASSFLEHAKLWRLILAHCRKHKCDLSAGLRRTLLELTLEEWREAREAGEGEVEKMRCQEALAMLTDSFAKDIGDYEALVIVQLAAFVEGEILLYERLQMTPMLLERYASDGGERARRQMLAMCNTDPELLADVLGYFVQMAGDATTGEKQDDDSDDSQNEAIFEDIQEALEMAQAQGVLPSVRVARILAGEGTGQFSTNETVGSDQGRGVPLSVALDYVGGILDEGSKTIARLTAEVEEYNKSCNAMEEEISALLGSDAKTKEELKTSSLGHTIDIEQMYAKLQSYLEEDKDSHESPTIAAQEEFWREMGQSEDRFETITRFFGKGIIP